MGSLFLTKDLFPIPNTRSCTKGKARRPCRPGPPVQLGNTGSTRNVTSGSPLAGPSSYQLET